MRSESDSVPKRPAFHRLNLIFLFVTLFSSASFSRAESPLDGYPALIHALVAGDYADAKTQCEQIEKNYPNHPAAMLARACLLGTRLVDFSGGDSHQEFMSLMERCAGRAETMKYNPAEDRAVLSFVRGGALFGQGFILCRDGNPLRGLNLILKGRAAFDEAIQLNPALYDAYLGRGAYRYGAAMYLSTVDILHLIVSEKAAMQDLWLAADSSQFCQDLAVTALIWMYIQKENYRLADSLSQKGLERYPQSRTFLWPQLVLQIKQEQWATAEQTALVLLSQYQQQPDDNGFEVIGLYHQLTRIADAMNHPLDARTYAQSGLTAKRSKEVAKSRKDILDQLAERVKP